MGEMRQWSVGKVALLACATVLLAVAPVNAAPPSIREVAGTYGNIAHAAYEDALIMARRLKAAIGKLVAKPSAATLDEARAAWRAARIPYMQTEAYRFGNEIVDDWEGKVNSWPLDEGLIDYVDMKSYRAGSDSNPLYTANVTPTRR
jgi:putative iron-regulated protein